MLDLDIRKTGLGASEAAGALGVSRYQTQWTTWARKVGILSGPEGWHLERGKALEPTMLGWYARTMDVKLEQPGTLRHPEIRCILATPDAIAVSAEDRGPVECKAPGRYTCRWWGEPGTDEIDPEYIPQVMQQLEVTGLDWCDVVASLAGDEPVVYRVHSRPRLQRRLVERLDAWWQRHIIDLIPPPADGTKEARKWAEELYGRHSGAMLEATRHLEDLAGKRARIMAEIKELTEEKGTIENHFRTIIADALGVEGDFGKCTWRRSEKTGRRTLRFTYKKG